MNLYVDDVRTPPRGWHLARTVEDAVAMLSRQTYDEVSLDFMIGEGERGNFLPVAEFIAALPPERRPRRVTLHTASPAGASRMHAVLMGKVAEIL